MSYPSFPHIPRIGNLKCIITEKIDGTNGLIQIATVDDNDTNYPIVRFGSRNRYLTPENDNAGFAMYFSQFTTKLSSNYLDTFQNTVTNIYGEWFGSGIGRRYDLTEKFFMPFNIDHYTYLHDKCDISDVLPPYILYEGKYNPKVVTEVMEHLKVEGSKVIPGYMNPEGIVVYFPEMRFSVKTTFEGPKYKLPKPESTSIIEKCIKCGKRLYLNKRTGGYCCRNYYCEMKGLDVTNE